MNQTVVIQSVQVYGWAEKKKKKEAQSVVGVVGSKTQT